MTITLNGHDIEVDSIYEHLEKNKLVASRAVPNGEPFPDLSFMVGVKEIETLEVVGSQGEIPLVGAYNTVADFYTNFTDENRNYGLALTYTF